MNSSPSHTIEIHLHEMSQLFNSMDPSPFNEKDLDRNAEDFIVSWAQEYPLNERLSLKIHLDQWPDVDPKDPIREAVHHYFSYRAKLTHLELRLLLKQGRTSLLIGLTFLAICIVIIKLFLTSKNQETWTSIVSESMTIAGWVAMWKPMQIYLYDWWPILKRERTFLKMSKIHIEVLPNHSTKDAKTKAREISN
ncbi:MAG: hypothetical protein ACXVAX_10600 [Pseudobdellovibrio sp.]